MPLALPEAEPLVLPEAAGLSLVEPELVEPPEVEGVVEELELDGVLELPAPGDVLELVPLVDGVALGVEELLLELEDGLDEPEDPAEPEVPMVAEPLAEPLFGGVVAEVEDEPEPPAGGVAVELFGAVELPDVLPAPPELLSPQPARARVPSTTPARSVRLSIQASPTEKFRRVTVARGAPTPPYMIGNDGALPEFRGIAWTNVRVPGDV